MKHSETVSVTQQFQTCDFCEKRLDQHKRCQGCNKDVCRNCCVNWTIDPWSGEDTGDYPPVVCKQCNAKVESFSIEAKKLTVEFHTNIDALYDKWKKKCTTN